jgi:hypothetical protein
MTSKRIGAVGLGAMGDDMSKNLLKAGFTVFGYDIAPSHVGSLAAAGGIGAANPAEAARADVDPRVVYDVITHGVAADLAADFRYRSRSGAARFGRMARVPAVPSAAPVYPIALAKLRESDAARGGPWFSEG